MQQNFEMFFSNVLRDEGNVYEDVAGDNGGPTKCGITIYDMARWCNIYLPPKISQARKHKNFRGLVDKVRALDERTAATIYKTYYWDALRADDLPWGLDYAVVDFGVNAGTGKAVEKLGALVGVPGTKMTDAMISAIKRYPSLDDLIVHYQEARKSFYLYISDPDKPEYVHNLKFRNGWLSREARVRKIALDLSRKADPADFNPPQVAVKAIDPTDDAPVPPDSMAQSKTGNSAIMVGSGGTYMSGQAVAQAFASAAGSHPASPSEFIWNLVISIMSDPNFWIGVVTIGLAAFIWLERRAKLIKFGV